MTPHNAAAEAAASARAGYFPARVQAWRDQGLSTRAAAALTLAGCSTLAQIRALGPSYFANMPGIGIKTFEELSMFAGFPPRKSTVLDAISAALKLTIHDPEEAREVATDIVLSLRRAKFVISAQKDAAR